MRKRHVWPWEVPERFPFLAKFPSKTDIYQLTQDFTNLHTSWIQPPQKNVFFKQIVMGKISTQTMRFNEKENERTRLQNDMPYMHYCACWLNSLQRPHGSATKPSTFQLPSVGYCLICSPKKMMKSFVHWKNSWWKLEREQIDNLCKEKIFIYKYVYI